MSPARSVLKHCHRGSDRNKWHSLTSVLRMRCMKPKSVRRLWPWRKFKSCCSSLFGHRQSVWELQRASTTRGFLSKHPSPGTAPQSRKMKPRRWSSLLTKLRGAQRTNRSIFCRAEACAAAPEAAVAELAQIRELRNTWRERGEQSVRSRGVARVARIARSGGDAD